MSYPLGHLGAGAITALCFSSGDEIINNRKSVAKDIVLAAGLSFLPDLDFLLYYTMPDKEQAFQLRHMTSHSVFFYLIVASVTAFIFYKKDRLKKFYLFMTVLILHSLMDMLYIGTSVGLFWPLQTEGFSIGLLPTFPVRGDLRKLFSFPALWQLMLEGLAAVIAIASILFYKIKILNVEGEKDSA